MCARGFAIMLLLLLWLAIAQRTAHSVKKMVRLKRKL